MQISRSLRASLHKLWIHVGPTRRRHFVFLLIVMVAASFAEVLSIGAVLPFLGVLTAPEKVFSHPAAQPLIHTLHLRTASELLLPLTAVFGIVAILNGAMRLLLLWSSTRICYATGAELSINIYQRTLYQPYSMHVSRNSSEIINTISSKTSTTIVVVMMLLNLLSSIVILLAILATLLAIDARVAFIAFAGFGAIYVAVIGLTRKSLVENSRRVAQESTQVIKTLQEGLGGIRDVLIDGSQAIYCSIYRKSDYRARIAQANSGIIGGSPRYAVEALAMLLISALAYFMAQEPGGLARTIPVLGALALGAQRMLPVMQQAYAAWATIKSSEASLSDTVELLDQPLPAWIGTSAPAPLSFERDISLERLTFRYRPDTPEVLKAVDLRIERGARVGFIGSTGSGKSTLLDLIMALLSPSAGELRVDDQRIDEENRRAWQAHLAHVPQSVFLSDASIEENIAFGVAREDIDRERVRQAAHRAQIADAIESWPQQYNTVVGERGVRLSGGQRQRIGIARALYKKADVIVFDEATSALDSETENAVMEAIESLDADLTILIIAHRISTLRGCNQVHELKEGRIAWSGSYEEISRKQNDQAALSATPAANSLIGSP